MKKHKNILVLEAGGPCAISCLKILKKTLNLQLIAADISPYAPGLQMADVAIIVPPSNSPKFAKSISKIIKKYNIDVILPCFEFGYKELSNIKGPFCTDFKSAILCKDKLKFAIFCEKNNLPYPNTKLLSKTNSKSLFPLYIKPRSGVGSRNNFIVNDFDELSRLKVFLHDTCDQYITQDLLKGDHWNVDVLVYNRKFITAVPRRDIVQKSGNCITVEVKNYLPLIKFAEHVQKTLKINSPFNLEVFETSNNNFTINEINARFGGGIIFSAMAGVDMVTYLADQNPNRLNTLKEGIYSRYYEELPINIKSIIKK